MKFVILFSLFFLLACGEDSTVNSTTDETINITYTDLSAEKAKELITTGTDVVIVDVSPKYDEGHIPGSINFYIGSGKLDSAIAKIDTSLTYLVYCHVDAASIPGAEKFINGGFKHVYRLEGNYSAWTDAGYDVETSTDSYIDINAATVKTLIEGDVDAVTIDVSPYFDNGHIPGALNYPLGSELDSAITMFDEAKKYIVYCHGDGPAISGATQIFEAGFSPVYRLIGNYGAWTGAGFEVE